MARAQPTPAAPWTVGLLIPMIHAHFFGDLVSGVVQAAAESGCRVVALQKQGPGLRLETLGSTAPVSPVARNRVDALISVLGAASDDDLRDMRAEGKPLVLIYHEPVPGLDCPLVGADDRGGIASVVDHLVDHGHRHIGFVGPDFVVPDAIVRRQAYEHQIRLHGLPEYETIVVPWMGKQPADEAVSRLRSLSPTPTALVCCTDVTALAVVRALTRAGVAVPEEVAVVGFDGSEDAAAHRPPLSTVKQDFTAIGRTGGQLAVDLLEGRPVTAGYHAVPVSLILRESCGCRRSRPEREALVVGGDPQALAEDQLTGVVGRLGGLLHDAVLDLGEPEPHTLVHLPEVARGMVELFAAAGTSPPAVLAARVEPIVSLLDPMIRQDRHVFRVVEVIRRVAGSWGVDGDAGVRDPGVRSRADDLGHDLIMALMARFMDRRPQTELYFQQQRFHYAVTTDLLRRGRRDSRSLAWLESTPVRAGCLAVWEGRPSGQVSQETLTIVESYGLDTPESPSDGRTPVRSFPPPALLDVVNVGASELVCLLPVQFDGSDRGFLGVVVPLTDTYDVTIELLNHWAVMATVSLDYEQAIEDIRVSEERYALAADAANEGLWDWGLASDTVYCSQRWRALMGCADESAPMTVHAWLARVHPEDRGKLEAILARQMAGNASTLELEHRLLDCGDGSQRWMLTRTRSVRDPAGAVTRLVCSMSDITDRKVLEERLHHDAHHDALTGLPNRALFMEQLDQAMARVAQNPDEWFAVVFLDLNGFKSINDTLGHKAGDEVLIQVSERLAGHMRSTDIVARLGGDEFVVLLDRVDDARDVDVIVGRLLEAVARPILASGHVVRVSAAAGTATSLAGYASAEEVLRVADAAMYQAKPNRGTGVDHRGAGAVTPG